LEALLSQQGEAIAVGGGGRGDPTGGAAAALDCFADQCRFDSHSAGFSGRQACFAATQLKQLPATAASVEPLAEQQAQGVLGFSVGHQHIRHERRPCSEAVEQTFRGLQQHGPLQQRQEIGKAGVLQQRQVPTAQGNNLQARGLSGSLGWCS
jgi:hypothetical protein